MGEIDLDAPAPWLGRTETKKDVLTQGLIDKFHATLCPHLWDGAGDVPLGIHWCIALDTVPTAALSEDGHAGRVDFCPLFRCPPACGPAAKLYILRLWKSAKPSPAARRSGIFRPSRAAVDL